MVTVKASYIVTPNEETPNGPLWLSDSDQVVRWSHTPTIYIYKVKDNCGDVMERLRESLSKVLVHYYPVAGRLGWIEGGRMKLDCNAKGAMLFEAKSEKTLAEFGDFSPTEPIKELLPAVDYSQPIEELPLFLVQLTSFRDDEGMAIGVAFAHPLSDGLGAIRFINAWAKIARGDTLGPDEMPFLDRTILKSSQQKPSSAPRFDHLELKPLPLKIGSCDSIAEQKKKTTMRLVKLRSEQVEKLRKRANDSRSYKQGLRPYSRFEAISALIWRCASMARDLDENQPTVVRFCVDFRNRLNPPLPKYYFGNALAPTLTPKCCVADIVSEPLSYGAQKIREAVETLTNDYISSQLDFIRGQEQLACIRHSFNEKGEQRKDVPFYGNPNIQITSWMSMPVYEADFGWGKPFYFGPGVVSPFDRATFALSPHGDGSVIVFFNFQVAHMEAFIKFFWEYVT